jgi:hypothetical protein
MHYQYHCACCNKVVASHEKECSSCGSHNIRSPFGFWIFCIVSCLLAAILVKSIHMYLSSSHEMPNDHSLLQLLQHDQQRSTK